MNQASEAAKKLASEFDVDLEQIEGSGQDGLITKADVQEAVDALASANIMRKKRVGEYQAAEDASVTLEEKEANGVILPSQEELLAIIRDMRGEIEELRENQAGLIARENQTRDLTDEKFFIAKPNGHRWEERRVVDGRTVAVEFVGTAFFGPFDQEEDIESYLAEKRNKREDSYIDWQGVEVMRGIDARRRDAAEKEERETHFSSSAPVNVLDRRIFAQQHTGHVPGVGQIVGQAQ